jgi:hypothetical protein
VHSLHWKTMRAQPNRGMASLEPSTPTIPTLGAVYTPDPVQDSEMSLPPSTYNKSQEETALVLYQPESPLAMTPVFPGAFITDFHSRNTSSGLEETIIDSFSLGSPEPLVPHIVGFTAPPSPLTQASLASTIADLDQSSAPSAQGLPGFATSMQPYQRSTSISSRRSI